LDLSQLSGILQFLLFRNPSDFEQLAIDRAALESAVVTLAAKNANEEDFEAMEDAINLFEVELNTHRLTVEGDQAFHIALLRASHSEFMIQVGSLVNCFFEEFKRTPYATDRADGPYNDEHRLILHHIKERDAESARKVLEQHLSGYK